jgi:hypothetical protein
LVVWQKSRQLAAAVYKLSERFPSSEQFALTNQARRGNIGVEQYCRRCRPWWQQRIPPVSLPVAYLSRGSLAELESQLLVASDLGYLVDEHSIFADCAEDGRMLNGLIASMTRLMARSDK